LDEEEISKEELQTIIKIYSELIESDSYKYLVKDILEVRGEGNQALRGCKDFAEYKGKEGVIDGIDKILNLPKRMIAQAKSILNI